MKKILMVSLIIPLLISTPCRAESREDLFDKGVLHFKGGDYRQAIETFSQLILMAPEHAGAYKNRGVAHMQLKDFDAALADFTLAAHLSPQLDGIHTNIGSAWFYKKQYQNAIDSYSKAILTTPDDLLAHFNRALCYMAQEQYPDAVRDLDKALSINPGMYPALCRKADILFHLGQKKEAVTLFERAIRLQPDMSYAQMRLSAILAPGSVSAPKRLQEKAATSTPSYEIQVGAFKSETNAKKLALRMKKKGFSPKLRKKINTRGTAWHLVRIGRYTSQQEAGKQLKEIKKKTGIKGLIRPSDDW